MPSKVANRNHHTCCLSKFNAAKTNDRAADTHIHHAHSPSFYHLFHSSSFTILPSFVSPIPPCPFLSLPPSPSFGDKQGSLFFHLCRAIDLRPVASKGFLQSFGVEDSFRTCTTLSQAKVSPHPPPPYPTQPSHLGLDCQN